MSYIESKIVCRYCGREMTPDRIEKAESWGIVVETQCPYCRMFLSRKLEGSTKERGLRAIKDILKDYKIKKKPAR